MAKRRLISEPASYPDVSIIGISSQLKDYRLAFFINRETGLRLGKIDDLPVYSEKEDTTTEFPIFTYHDTAKRLDHFLMANNNAGFRIFPAYKQADFLLMIKGLTEAESVLKLTGILKKINGIQLAFSLDNDKIKNLEGVMTDLELHMVGK